MVHNYRVELVPVKFSLRSFRKYYSLTTEVAFIKVWLSFKRWKWRFSHFSHRPNEYWLR